MQPSKQIIAFVKNFEKCKLTAYMPTPNDKPTLGWGSTGPDIKLGMRWTQEQADARFTADANKFAAGVTALLTGPTRQDQFDAMFSLAYNIGLAAFKGSTVLRKHNAGDYTGAANAFVMWNKQAGKVLNGLTRRRLDEAEIYR